ncbi:MAG: hypothetical protein ABR580_12385 [Halomonas sp.]
MSNGPYGQMTCDCGAVSLLVSGSPLALGKDTRGEPVAFWTLDAIQIGRGADELNVTPQSWGGDTWACRRCDECLLYAHDEAGMAILVGHPEDTAELVSGMTTSGQRWLEELGYQVVAGK